MEILLKKEGRQSTFDTNYININFADERPKLIT